MLKLLKDSGSLEAQMATVTVLLYLANNEERVQSLMVNLVARMAEHDYVAYDDFTRENVTHFIEKFDHWQLSNFD